MDPFLLTHRIRDGLYDVGPRISPISIRDQMIRSHSLVLRAIREQIIGENKPLLIVGAGAAGATAAMTAAARNVPTTVLERSSAVFSLQAGSKSRHLDPTMYDWPLDHWAMGKFEWIGSAVPLRWDAASSAAIAASWEERFEEELSKFRVDRNPRLKIVRGAELENPTKLRRKPRSKPMRVHFKGTDGRRAGPFYFEMIISCVGAGLERVELGEFRGKSFWDDDSYGDENLGLPGYMVPRVVISGSGDGALQDFLRIVTNKGSAKAIYQSLPTLMQDEVASYIASKEDHYQRAYAWSGNHDGNYKLDDCKIQKSLHADYLDIVSRMLAKYETDLASHLEPVLRVPGSMTVSLVFECDHFSHCYPLNHFLALLLARYLEKPRPGGGSGKSVLHPNTRIVQIEPVDRNHVCNKQAPDECEEESHEAYFVSADCQTQRDAINGPVRLLEGRSYNIVIVRHGIVWNDPLFGQLPNASRRHLLPYYLGWGDPTPFSNP